MADTFISCRPATFEDIPALVELRAPDEEAGPADARMARYLAGEHHPQLALEPRTILLAEAGDGRVVGYTGGHLTQRYDCEGELQYLYVVTGSRRSGVATLLARELFRWFRAHGAERICVDVEPANHGARAFYRRLGATDLSEHWMVWEPMPRAP